MKQRRCDAKNLLRGGRPATTIKNAHADLRIGIRTWLASPRHAAKREEGRHERRMRPIEQWCRIAVVLRQAEKRRVLGRISQVEQVTRTGTQNLVQLGYVLFEKAPQIAPTMTMKRRAQSPRFTLTSKDESLLASEDCGALFELVPRH